MKSLKIIFMLLISLLILTGCGIEIYEYDGSEKFYELSGIATDEINANGAKVIVSGNQAFVELNDDTNDYAIYTKGEYKIKKKDDYYQYYFIRLEHVNDNKFLAKEPIVLTDETYGTLELKAEGTYDYKISNIYYFMYSFVKVDSNEFMELGEYVDSILLDTIVEEITKLDVKFSDLYSYSETIEQSTIKGLEKKGITCSRLDITSIELTEESLSKVKAIDVNNLNFKSYIQNTTWIAADNSEMIFDIGRFNWYLNKGDYSDNVQYGDYTFYSDTMAVKYITEDLKSYGVSQSVLDKLFASNEKYDTSNFVVFSINLEGYTIDGKVTTVNKPIYWYGFLLNNNQNLQVFNMNTEKYYNFTKKSA